MILIGLSGKKRTGKNTVSSQLKLITNLTIDEFAFAYPLKVELAKMLKVTVKEIELNKDLYRPMLQAYGTDYCRVKFGTDYWIKQTFREILKSQAEICVITDVRFPDEADAIRAAGGYVVSVVRDTGLVDTHISEKAMDGYSHFDEITKNQNKINGNIQTKRKLNAIR
jgi:hypothetical protein